MRRRDLLNLGGLGTRCVQPGGVGLAAGRGILPSAPATPVGDPLQALLDGNAPIRGLREPLPAGILPGWHGNGYWPTTGKTTAIW